MSSVVEADVRQGLAELGLAGAAVEVHSSLSSFGHVVNGEHTIVSALTSTLATVLVPTYSHAAEVDPPVDDRPARNGIDYSQLPRRLHPASAFCPETTPIDRYMGAVPRAIAALQGARRSGHPLSSWAAWGSDAEHFVANHDWSDPCRPLKRLAERGGYFLLLGVTLRRCSAMHLAEEMAGRKHFIRWVIDAGGQTRRVRAGGDGDGFDRVFSSVKDLFRITHIGLSRAICAPLQPFVERVAQLIRADPEITLCDPRCLPCRDACAGGPVE